jgi:hypothetical protein
VINSSSTEISSKNRCSWAEEIEFSELLGSMEWLALMMQIHLTLKYFILMLETLSYNLNKKEKILTEEEAKVSKITN